MEARNALRVCSPGPPLGVNPLFKNCLIIGESISLGYLTTVKGELKGLCQVQHAPFAKGSGAVDSRYGLQCLSMMLSTTSLEPTHYDAVVFNFGMHDIDYSKLFPEEFVPIEDYGQNLRKIKNILLQSGAQVAFALTTPVPIAGLRNKRVIAYNKEALRIMEEGPRVDIIDLHAAVIKVCGEPPYDTCSIMKQPRDVHFNPKGSHILGIKVGATLRGLLSRAKPRGQFSPPKAPELSTREGLASSYLHDDTSFCPDMVTRCPARTTCCEDLLSLTGYGCCMEPNAVSCPDSWHCCPRGSHCSPSCSFRSCKCVFPSTHPIAENFTKEGTKINMRSKSESETHAAGSVPVEKAMAKHLMSKERKEKENKHKAKLDNNQTKLHEKVGGKSKHIVKPTESKTDGLKQGRKHKARKKTKKNKSKPYKNSLGIHKSMKSRKAKTIQKISKNVVKAHRKHQKTRFHHKKKQQWINVFHHRFGALKKRKPHIKFSHTWGKEKHQKLSFKSNKHTERRPIIDVSMTEELKHLIVNHRKEKLRARLRLHSDNSLKYLYESKKNGYIQRKKSKTLKKLKGRKSHRVKIRRIFSQHKAKYHKKHLYRARRPSIRYKLKKDGFPRKFAKVNAEGTSEHGHLKKT
ncbi:uncharacterized protein LOC111346630 [Stylophora pistillata]|uniref:uncharacterized protein LOC111346630 n=1 Tax=Stylophora pistillata TaxID=50429 RepID=UPI000C03C689|nr:uncharacterized protein LOC111346630 [Stylophora pistillata]